MPLVGAVPTSSSGESSLPSSIEDDTQTDLPHLQNGIGFGSDSATPDAASSSPVAVNPDSEDRAREAPDAIPSWSTDPSLAFASWYPPHGMNGSIPSESNHDQDRSSPAPDISSDSEQASASDSALPGSTSSRPDDVTDPSDQVDRPSTPAVNHPETPGGLPLTDEWSTDEPIGQGLKEGQELFKKYVLKKKLGTGGMGEVWLVHHIELDCDRALKFIRTGLTPSPELKRRFRREARAMAKVSHPNAVEIHDAFTSRGLAFIEMAYVPGKSLLEILKRGQPMSLDWTARILEQLCEVLAVAHEAGIVHRDLKPANLMLLNDRAPGREFLKVLDFGIAKLLRMEEADGASMSNNAPMGTYPYMSPEQFGYGNSTVDQRSDVYTVGVILFEFLTGYRPYSARNNLYQWLQKHVNEPIPTFHDRNPNVDVPAKVEQVVRRCLAKSADDRPPSAQSLFEEFAEAAEFVRPPSRPGSSMYTAQVVAPTTRDPAISSSSSSSSSSSLLAPSQPIEPAVKISEMAEESGDAPNPDTHKVGPSQVVEMADLSTLSDSYEWQSPETEDVVRPLPIREVRPIDVRPPSPDDTDPVIDIPVIDPGGDQRRPSRLFNRRVAFSLMLGVFGGSGAIVGVPRLMKLLEKRDKKEYQPPPPPPPSLLFPLNSTGHRWKESLYDLYGKVAYLPEGYMPKEGTEAASDDWPKVIERKADGVEFVRIVGGTYLPYVPWGDPLPKGTKLEGFYLQKFEVTNQEIEDFYEKDSNAGLRKAFEEWRFDYPKDVDPLKREEKSRWPAVFVSWEGAARYAQSVSGKLPTEKQWLFAATSRRERLKSVWDENLKDMAFVGIHRKQDGRRKVGDSRDDRTIQDVYDMGGNVREWCQFGDGANQTHYCGGCYNDSFEELDWLLKKPKDLGADPVSEEVGFRVLLECPTAEQITP
jgi:serine/threonine protein kinase